MRKKLKKIEMIKGLGLIYIGKKKIGNLKRRREKKMLGIVKRKRILKGLIRRKRKRKDELRIVGKKRKKMEGEIKEVMRGIERKRINIGWGNIGMREKIKGRLKNIR